MNIEMKIVLTAVDEHGDKLNPAIVAYVDGDDRLACEMAVKLALKAVSGYRREFHEKGSPLDRGPQS